MKTLFLLFALAVTPALAAHAQESDAPEGARIAAADVTGIAIDALSAELRADITALAGTAIARDRLEALATRIETEKPDMVAAVRRSLLPGGEAHVTFVVAHVNDDPGLLANINSRYVIESVSVTGIVAESNLPQTVRDQLQAVVGKRLDPAEGDRLTRLIQAQYPLLSGFEVKRRFERGTQPGQLRLIFDVRLSLVERLGLLYQPKLVYHARQGWSALLNLPIPLNYTRIAVGVAIADEDDLIEQYSGFHVRFARDRIGTPRLAASVEVSRYTQRWRETTLAALDADPAIPGAYDSRLTLQPRVTVRLWPYASVSGGLILASLDPVAPGSSSAVSAATLGVSSSRRWIVGTASHALSGSYEVHAASGNINSDLDYTRHRVTAGYRYRQGFSTLIATAAFGRAHGETPLFERFALGDTNTLRGWNKFDLAPAGGTRMSYQSVEYRFWFVGAFLDAGSVWDPAGRAATKYSTGVGLHDDHAFITVAFPIDANDHRATFMMGLRF